MTTSSRRKQRKARAEAPLHKRQKMVSAHLSKELRKEHGTRAVPLRKGDEVVLMRGKQRKVKGTVEIVDLKRLRVFVKGVSRKKVNGAEVLAPLQPSNLMITKLNLEDKRRVEALKR